MEIEALTKMIESLPAKARKSVEDLVIVMSYKEDAISSGRGFGALRGKIWMSDDFNEPIKVFHSYSYTIDLKVVEKLESLPIQQQHEIEAHIDELLSKLD